MPVSISFKVSLPKQKFADKKWVDEIIKALETKAAPKLEKYFNETVKDWKGKPHFQRKLTRNISKLSMLVYTTSEKYALVNAGAPEHPIFPRRGGFLRFKPGYQPATTPGQLRSRRAYRFGTQVAARSIPKHPGFEARKFDELVAKEYEPQFQKDIQDAINKIT